MEAYDIIIVGGGPIGASTAYFLSQTDSSKKIALITDDPEGDRSVTYRYAGGSISWYWADPLRTEMTTVTANFIKRLIRNKKVDLGALEHNYHALYQGTFTPSLNIRSAALVQYFLSEAEKSITVQRNSRLSNIEKLPKGGFVLTAGGKSYKTKRLLLALGVHNEDFIPDIKIVHNKRQIFVTDLPVDASREKMPHTIVPIGKGYGYVFIKKFPNGLKVVVGQEDVFDHSDETKAIDYYDKLMETTLGEVMPWLKDAKVTDILWAIDVEGKLLQLYDDGNGLLAANCGSAVRSCVWIGKELSKKLSSA